MSDTLLSFYWCFLSMLLVRDQRVKAALQGSLGSNIYVDWGGGGGGVSAGRLNSALTDRSLQKHCFWPTCRRSISSGLDRREQYLRGYMRILEYHPLQISLGYLSERFKKKAMRSLYCFVFATWTRRRKITSWNHEWAAWRNSGG